MDYKCRYDGWDDMVERIRIFNDSNDVRYRLRFGKFVDDWDEDLGI